MRLPRAFDNATLSSTIAVLIDGVEIRGKKEKRAEKKRAKRRKKIPAILSMSVGEVAVFPCVDALRLLECDVRA